MATSKLSVEVSAECFYVDQEREHETGMDRYVNTKCEQLQKFPLFLCL